MLTDIFAYRYLNHPIWTDFTEVEQRLLNQAFSIVNEALPHCDSDGKGMNKTEWQYLHDQLARELGVDELSKRYYSYTQKNYLGQDVPVQGFLDWYYVCEHFFKDQFTSVHRDPDRFIKERISFIELAMRFRGQQIEKINSQLSREILEAKQYYAVRAFQTTIRVPGDPVEGVKNRNKITNDTFASQISELNERFLRARAPLTYHNGFIQVSRDQLIEQNVAAPFWDLVAEPLWKNVDIDMKEALDRRDSNDKDPSFYAARALESTIKIISKKNSWTHGKETGAGNYIDNLVSKANGRFLEVWEGNMLKDYFSKARNPFGHGPGSAEMPELSIPQTDWAIETAMSWIRNLIRRFEEHTNKN